MAEECKITPITGGPKAKFYCSTCNKLFDEPNPHCHINPKPLPWYPGKKDEEDK